MISCLVDEISQKDIKRINEFLDEYAFQSSLEQIYWVKVPPDILSEEQFRHSGCQPHVFAVELGKDWVKIEFFIRSLRTLHCTCPGFPTEQQRRHIIDFAHGMLEKLGIRP